MPQFKVSPMDPTPKWAKLTFRYFFIATTFFAGAVQTLPEGTITKEMSDTINAWVIWANGAVYLLSNLFGVKLETVATIEETVTQTTTLKVEEVEKPIDEKPKTP